MHNPARNSSHQAAFNVGVNAAPSPAPKAGAPNVMSAQMSDGPMPRSNTNLRGASRRFFDKEGVPNIPKSRQMK